MNQELSGHNPIELMERIITFELEFSPETGSDHGVFLLTSLPGDPWRNLSENRYSQGGHLLFADGHVEHRKSKGPTSEGVSAPQAASLQ